MAAAVVAQNRKKRSWRTPGLAILVAIVTAAPGFGQAESLNSSFEPPRLGVPQESSSKNQNAQPLSLDAPENRPFVQANIINNSVAESNNLTPAIQQTSCTSCGAGLLGNRRGAPIYHNGPGGHIRDRLFIDRCTNCGAGQCIPGREHCYPCEGQHTAFHRFMCGLYDCLCCPDPCYEPKWLPLADSAFFVESARPVTQTKIRWDRGFRMILADRSEYFWARADGMGKGPAPQAPVIAVPQLNYHELSMYTEVSTGKLGVIVETPYRSLDPDFGIHAAGFSDMNTAIKTLIFDCELLQVSTMMRTYIPIGNFRKGTGVGHVSLEPSLIFSIKLNRDAYFQGQIAEWIPIGGDPEYSGAILHYHFAVNRRLIDILPDVPLIGTLEMSGYSFQDGAYTDPVFGPFQESSNSSYFYVGAGLRMFVCDRIDFGAGFHIPLTEQHFAEQLFRTEFRWRF